MDSMIDYSPDLMGRTAVITGATSGIGLAAAILFSLHGARIIGIGRDPQRAEDARRIICKESPDARIDFFLADLSSQNQIHHLVEEIGQFFQENNINCLDILVNNAGTYSQHKILTEDGIEKTYATNHLAPFLLTQKLLPWLEKSPSGRVITVSSDSHYGMTIDPDDIANPRWYIGILAYAKSKLANILFTSEFNRRYGHTNVHAYALDPGLVKTNIAFKDQPAFSRLVWKIRRSAGDPPEKPARTILFLASEPSIQTSPENYWCNSKPKRCSQQAARSDLARMLWESSVQLCEGNSAVREIE